MPADASVYVPAIIDLAGTRCGSRLAPDAGAATQGREIPRPAELDQAGVSPQIEILSDVMLSASEKFMTTIPSTQEDFAFFQAQRKTAAAPSSDLQNDLQPPPAAGQPAAASDQKADTTIPKPAGARQSMQATRPFPHSRRPRIENTRVSRSSRMSISGSRRPRHVREDPQSTAVWTALRSMRISPPTTPSWPVKPEGALQPGRSGGRVMSLRCADTGRTARRPRCPLMQVRSTPRTCLSAR